MNNLLLYKISSVILVMMLFLGVIVLISILSPTGDVLTNVKQPYNITTPTIPVDGQIIYVVDNCKVKNLPASVTRAIVNVEDGTQYSAASQTNVIPPGCNKTPVVMDLPGSIPPGRYYVTLLVQFNPDIFHQISYYFKTEDFTIVEKK